MIFFSIINQRNSRFQSFPENLTVMRKLSLSFFIVIVAFYSQLCAQDFRAGGGLAYGSQINTLGINFRGDVNFNNQWSITPHYNLFFNKDHGIISDRWREINIDVHYFFFDDERWKLYPLAGFNLATVSEKVNSIIFSNSYAGLNLGMGSEYHFSEQISGFGEIKYVVSNADQMVISVGVLYKISK